MMIQAYLSLGKRVVCCPPFRSNTGEGYSLFLCT